jgi:hypothetical protein
VYRDDNKKPMV